MLEAEVGKVRSAGGTVVEAHLIEGRVAPQVVALAEEIGVGLIVMGSVSDSVVRHAHCPVMVVRDGEREGDYLPGRILLATDGSKEAHAAA